ncbi:MAG: Gfo/Idh/MocA family oxidoreductase, partial [Chloroflexi bacterium]|nr:Gfo/Idh/MocA family oxidoreductase [Chloroflexota bacterium]
MEQIARQFKIERAFTKWEDVVAVTDLVSIAAPTPEHKIICEAALSAGKNVLCEKPLALNARDARAMLGAAEQRKLVHAANFEMRFLPAFQYAKELIDEDYLGEFFRADVTMAMERPWGEHGNWAADDARGGGVLMEVGSHFLDVMRWWFGNARAVLASRRTNFPNVKTRDEQIKGNGKTATTLITADDALWCALQFERGEALLNFVTGARYDPGWTINAYGALGTLVIKSGELLGRRDGDLHLEPLAIPKRLEQNEKPNDPLMWGMVKLFERVAAK